MIDLLDHRAEMQGRLEGLNLTCVDSGAGFGCWDLAFFAGDLYIVVDFDKEAVRFDLSWGPDDPDGDSEREHRTFKHEGELVAAVAALLPSTRRRVEVPVVSIDVHYAYTHLSVPNGLTPQQEQDFVHDAYRRDGFGWETEHVRNLSMELLIDAEVDDVHESTTIQEA